MKNRQLFKGVVLGVFVSLVIVATLAFTQSSSTNGKVGYIKMGEVYESFEGMKEQQKELAVLESKQKAVLDSLKYQIVEMERKTISADPELNQKKQLYNTVLNEFQSNNQLELSKAESAIWTQINQYVGDYGVEYGYDFIHGANGQGNIMFAAEKNDLTQEVIAYINEKYLGEK